MCVFIQASLGCINLCYIKYILHNKTGEIIMEHQDCNLLEKITFQSPPLSEPGVTPTSDRSCWWIYQENLLVYFPVSCLDNDKVQYSSALSVDIEAGHWGTVLSCPRLRKLIICTVWLPTSQTQCEVRTDLGKVNRRDNMSSLSSLPLQW